MTTVHELGHLLIGAAAIVQTAIVCLAAVHKICTRRDATGVVVPAFVGAIVVTMAGTFLLGLAEVLP